MQGASTPSIAVTSLNGAAGPSQLPLIRASDRVWSERCWMYTTFLYVPCTLFAGRGRSCNCTMCGAFSRSVPCTWPEHTLHTDRTRIFFCDS